MSSNAQTIFNLLAQKQLRYRIGHFAGSGIVDVPLSKAPQVNVAGLGLLGAPLPPQQAAALIACMQQAPFGKGLDTVIDVDVRRAWQLGADRVSLNPRWTLDMLPGVVNEACEQLGLDAAALGVQAHLYKLLCYEAGGHFKTHRDSEKEPGMFATLIVQLPSQHQGGDLVVQHRGEQMRLNFADGSADTIRYAAFYADCEHTLEPVTEGVRLVLAYNLVRTKADQGLYPMVGEQQASRARLSEAVRNWINETQGAEVEGPATGEKRRKLDHHSALRKKLVYLLGHKYSKTSLSFDGLKGADRMLLRTLQSLCWGADAVGGLASDEPLLDVYLCLIERHFHDPDTETGNHEYEESVSVPLCISEKGSTVPFPLLDIDFDREILGKRMPYGEPRRFKEVEGGLMPAPQDTDSSNEDKVSKKDLGEGKGVAEDDNSNDEDEEDDEEDEDEKNLCYYDWDDQPDKVEQEGYTGNDGYTADTWYYTAAIVFWPRSQAFHMVRKVGSFLRLAELAEDATARGAPYGETYLSDLVDILLDTSVVVREKSRWSSFEGDIIDEDLKLIFSKVFSCVSSVDFLARAVQAAVARKVDFDDDADLTGVLADTMVRLAAGAKAVDGQEEALIRGFEAVIAHFLSSGRLKVAASLVHRIKGASALTGEATTSPLAGTASSAQPPSFLSAGADRLATGVAKHCKDIYGTKNDMNIPSLLPFLASFDSGIPVLESVAESVNKGDKELPFSQYAAIASTVLGAPREPPMLPTGHSALVTILGGCSAALGREASPNAPDVAWMFWALLQLSMQHPEYRRALDALADAIQAHPKSKALLKPLLANADVQEAIRRGDDATCRRLCEQHKEISEEK